MGGSTRSLSRQLKKQMPGKCRQRGRMRHSRAFRQREKLPHHNCQALLQPCPRSPSSHLQIRRWFFPPLLIQVLLLSSQPTPSLLQLPVAGIILQPLPSCSTVCLLLPVPAFQKRFSPPPLPVIPGWVLECLLLTASFSSHFHPSGRATAVFVGHTLQGHSRWDAPPPAAVQD